MSRFRYVNAPGADELASNPSEQAEENRSYVVLIIYDITDNRRRSRMVKCLEGYGIRVQKSAFEAYLTKRKCEEMAGKAAQFIQDNTDSLRIYLLANRRLVRSWGAKVPIIEQDSIIV